MNKINQLSNVELLKYNYEVGGLYHKTEKDFLAAYAKFDNLENNAQNLIYIENPKEYQKELNNSRLHLHDLAEKLIPLAISVEQISDLVNERGLIARSMSAEAMYQIERSCENIPRAATDTNLTQVAEMIQKARTLLDLENKQLLSQEPQLREMISRSKIKAGGSNFKTSAKNKKIEVSI